MKKMRFIVLFLLVGCAVWSADGPTDVLSRFSGEERQWVTGRLTAADVKDMFAHCVSLAGKGELTSSWVQVYIGRLNRLKKYEFFESDTGISKKWLDSCIAFLKALEKTDSKISVMTGNKKTDTKEYKQWAKYYKDTAKQFAALVKSPIPANQVTVNTLAQKKKALLDAYKQQQKAKAKAGKKGSKVKPKK